VNRALRILLASAAVLLSGTVAFGVAAAITPPGVDGVDVVVTDRPVLSVAAVAEPIPASVAPAVAGVTTRADKPAADAPSVQNKTVVTGVASGSRPKSIVVPEVKPKPPTGSVNNDSNDDSDSDHEVVTPPVRDEDDDDDDSDDENTSDSSPSSNDYETKSSQDTTRRSGVKGD